MAKGEKLSFKLAVERHGPGVCAFAALLALSVWKPDIIEQFSKQNWRADGLYTAVFSWASIQIGFAFGVYGFVAARSSEFIKAMKETKAMERFVGYVKRANLSSFVLTLTSLPLIVVSPELKAPSAGTYLLVSIWFSIFVWTFFTFLRIAHSFGHISSVRDAPPFFSAGK